ncbi:MAG: hypothetical protein HY059_08185 [Proteobacteria bacterium]|nr:hypothetical protein [Pseudomonadota bacterium]
MQKARPARGTRKRRPQHRPGAAAAPVDLLSPSPDNAVYVYVAGRGRRGLLIAGATGNLASLTPLRLLWFERLDDIPTALALAERIAQWPQIWKIQMIDRTNPKWLDLAPTCC